MYKPKTTLSSAAYQSQKAPKITKFSELPIIKNGLYVFDIDETLLVFDEISEEWWKRNYEKFLSESGDVQDAYNTMHKLFSSIITKNAHYTTDIDGFRKIEENLGRYNNKIVFLTARPSNLAGPTHRQIASLNLKDAYPIYFSSEKGEEMKKIINKARCGYESVVFVDDKIYNIEAVQKECPEVQCFQFVPDEYIEKLKLSKKEK